MKCQKNTHTLERVARVIAGLVLITLAFVGPANKWLLIGLVPLVTGLSGWCPLYQVLGFRTNKQTIDKTQNS